VSDAARPATIPPWVRAGAAVNLSLGILFVAIFLFFTVRAQFQVPYMDDWEWLNSLQDPSPFSHSLWRLHNEHVIVVPRLLVWLDFRLWGWPGFASLTAALLSHIAIAAILTGIVWEKYDGTIARLIGGTVLILVFLTYDLQGVVFPAAGNFPLVAGFAMLSIWLLARVPAAAPSTRRLRIVLSGASCLLAMVSVTNGLLLPLVLAMVSALSQLSRRTTAAFLLLGIGGLSARYVLGGTPAAALVNSTMSAAMFALAFLGGAVASVSAPLGIGLGAILAATGVHQLWKIVRRRAGEPGDLTLAGILAFVLLSAAMAGTGRAQFGMNNAAQSRYTVLTSMYWAALLVLVAGEGLSARRRHVLAVVLPVAAVIALPLQVLVGLVWQAKADHLRTASLALASGVEDEAWIWRLHVLGMPIVRPVLGMLAARQVAFLQLPGRADVPPSATASPPRCEANLALFDPNLAGEPSTGLRLLGRVRQDGDVLIVSDRDSTIRGVARKAPVLSYGRAFADDFVRAVLARLRTPGRDRDSWVGFASRGAGPPYEAELLDSQRRSICRAAVDCCSAPPPVAYAPVMVGAVPVEGVLDEATCTYVSGWVWDQRRPVDPATVRITSSSGATWTVAAGNLRPDLVGKGNRRHGFHVEAPAFQLPPGSWRVDAFAVDGSTPLIGNSKTVVCGP
jgi:hypothetical protein